MGVLIMKIGLIGTGSIGTFLLEKINHENMIPGFQITAIFDDREKSKGKLQVLAEEFNLEIYHGLDRFLDSSVDLIVECANIEVVKQYAELIASKKDLFLISVGAFAESSLHLRLKHIAEEKGRSIYLPSGAISGLDVLQSGNILGGLDTVQLVTRKPAHALSDGSIEKETILFDGVAKDAIALYPKNANIAITLSLAGLGVDKTKVKIIADPLVDKNIHHLEVWGDFGTLHVTLANNPSPNNPKTSYLTALSVLSSLKSLNTAIKIG